jgi:two-component system sensor histidine kinase UhpB
MITLAMLLIVGVGAVFVLHNARRSVDTEVRSSVTMALQLIEAGVARNVDNEAALMDWLRDLSLLEQTRHLRIQVRRPPEKIIQFAGPPRLETPGVPGWFVWAVSPAPLVGEKLAHGLAGQDIHIGVEANPADEIEEAWIEARGFLLMMLTLAAAIAMLVHITLGRAFKSVNVILKGLTDIEQGNYGSRIEPIRLPEFDRISAAVNHMAETLESARSENRRLGQRSLALQEEERRHVARELHDELGQSIGAVRLMAASLRKPQDARQIGETVDAILGICDRLFGVIRAIMRRMRPLVLDELGLVAALEDMAETWRVCNPGVRLELKLDPETERRAGNAGIHVFRLVQEGLTNVSRHARASAVTVGLKAQDRLVLELRDDGVGFDTRCPSAGHGLHGMRERVANLGGEFRLQSAPGEGAHIEIRLPYPEGET